MRFKTTTWILLLALVVIAAYYFFVDERARTAKERNYRQNRKLFSYSRGDVERFILINPKGERIEVAQSGSLWKIVSPVEAPGDQPEIASFLDQVTPGRRGIELADVRNLADYGLEKPFATLIMYRRSAAAPDTLFVGDKTATSSNSYVRLGGSTSVFISSQLTHNVMNRSLFHLRDKNFLPPGTESISSIAIHRGHETLRLKKEGTFWWFAARHVRADRARIEGYLIRLTDAVIHRFVREDTAELASYGLQPPAGEITLTKKNETVRISFGNKEDGLVNVVRTRLDKVIMLEASLLEPLEWSADNLRAMNLAFFSEDSVRMLRFETSDTSIVFSRTETRWSTAAADTVMIRSWQVNGLLRKLESTTFETILEEPLPRMEPQLDRYLIRVTLEGTGGTVLDRITIASRANGSEIGASTSANAVGALTKGTAAEMETIFRQIGAK